MSTIRVQDPSLVVLIGVSGSGKSTFASHHFGPYETVSSDYCRGLVSNDPNDQSVTAEAFALLNEIVAARLRRNLLTAVDATNVQPHARAQLVSLARAHDVLPVASVLDVGAQVASERNAVRTDRRLGPHVIERQQGQLRKSVRGLQREGFRSVHHLRSEQEIAELSIERVPLLTDRRSESGPFDAIGDVHGCLDELLVLLDQLGYEVVRDGEGRAVDAAHPAGRRAIFLGDLVDRGPDSPGVLRLVMGMVAADHALAVPGNHEEKLLRALGGRKVTVSHGLETTLAQLANESEEFRAQVATFGRELVSHAVLDDGRLVVAHAGLKESYHNRASGRVRAFALYGDTTGESDEYGLPVRYPWAQDYRGEAMVLYGHTPTPRAEWINNTMCLDTGCAFGGSLSALRYPERELVSVPAARVYYEPAKPFLVPEDPGAGEEANESAPERAPEVLDLSDVMGVRGVDTALLGRVSIPPENAAGALEVMSRFALAPRSLPYLPPTMSPVATSHLPGYLEHPSEAFSFYARDGVSEVVCEEKHMGSRAVVLVCRGEGGRRFGLESGSPGVAYTRTGRRLLTGEVEDQFLTRVREAVTSAGLWERLEGAEWILFDAEIVPWSLKTEPLIREQYASVGAAAAAAMPAALEVLANASARGVDVNALHEVIEERADNASRFRESYRRYRWEVTGLDGVQLAPFQVLASGRAEVSDAVGKQGIGTTYETKPHLWHLDVADSLVAADPARVRTTRRFVVELADADSRAAAVTWWEDLTATGGEGMVVKPAQNLVTLKADGRPTQPGLKVRGREYLRLIYGPDYTSEENLSRLRERRLGRKRSLAQREYALGLEALARLVQGEPTWRVHQSVFGVLALESEPVDPRL